MFKTNQAYRDERVASLQEHYKLLTGSIRISLLTSTCLAIIISTILYGHINSSSLFVWFTLICLVNFIRLSVYYWLKNQPISDPKIIITNMRFFRFGALFSGLVWGWAGFYFAQQVELVYQLFITFTLGGLAAGAASSLAVDKFAVISFISASLLPNLMHYFLSGSEISVGMGIMLLLFIFFILNTAKDQGRSLHDNIRLRIRAKRDETQFKEILNFSPLAVSIASLPTLKTLFTNERHLELFGTDSTPFGKTDNSVFTIEQTEIDNIKNSLLQQQSVTNKLLKLVSNHSEENFWCIGSFVPINYLDTPAVLSWFFDITERVRMEEQIKQLAYRDSLTNLPNRYLFEDHLRLALKQAERDKLLLGVMFIDLDGFKSVNDTFGHGVGDQLLKDVATRLSDTIRQADTLSRIGGDEFIILLPKIKSHENGIGVARKILIALAEPFDIANHKLKISASIGIAVYPDHGKTAKGLLKNADNAMYQVKDSGKNNVQLYKAQTVSSTTEN